MEVREEVKWFAELMEKALQAHEDKGGWQEDAPHVLLARLVEEASELTDEIIVSAPAFGSAKLFTAKRLLELAAEELRDLGSGVNVKTRGDFVREAVDVGNFAMMLADNARRTW